jgi:hypothetical protein
VETHNLEVAEMDGMSVPSPQSEEVFEADDKAVVAVEPRLFALRHSCKAT